MAVEASATRRIRDLRGAREAVDPWRPVALLREKERTIEGGRAPCFTVFLAGAECPFSCSFCDLWRHTLNEPTPRGALPAQIERALEELTGSAAGDAVPSGCRLNFFEPRAVPRCDLHRIAELAAPFERLVVECHPRLVDQRALEFAASLEPRLEVAMGLETVHPEILPRLNKEMTRRDFDRAGEECRGRQTTTGEDVQDDCTFHGVLPPGFRVRTARAVSTY